MTIRSMPGIEDERAGRDPRPAADDQDRLGLGMDQGGEVPEHPLEPHVGRIARGFDLAADVEIARPVAELDHGDGRIHALAHENEVAGSGPGQEVSALGNELPGDVRHGTARTSGRR